MMRLDRRQFIQSASLALTAACTSGPVRHAGESNYQPLQTVSGDVSIWGHGSLGGKTEFMESLIAEWDARFRQFHPQVSVQNCMFGTASAIGALYSGQGDLALMGREIWPSEVAAYEEVMGHKPTGISILTGSHAVRNKGYALTVFVHKDNPVERLTLAELDAIFGAEYRRGHNPVTTWGELGAGDAWRSEQVNLYGIDLSRGFARFFEEAVFLDGRIWNPRITEFADLPGSTGGKTDGGHMVLEAIAEDRFGIGYSGMLYSHPGVKPVAVAKNSGNPYVFQNEDTVRDRSYPLTRIITMFLRGRLPCPPSPATTEFMRFVLSADGQSAIETGAPGYLSLTPEIAARELTKLEEMT